MVSNFTLELLKKALINGYGKRQGVLKMIIREIFPQMGLLIMETALIFIQEVLRWFMMTTFFGDIMENFGNKAR